MKILHGHSVVLCFVIIFLNAVLANDCLDNEFQCSSGKCIPPNWLCDGEDDCGNDHDEKDCGDCGDRFRCDSGRCVDADWTCDGDADCDDGSDEKACPATTAAPVKLPPTWPPVRGDMVGCYEHEFTCTDGTCILSEWLCDGFVDCVDALDEDRGNCAVTTVAPTVDPEKCPATNPFAYYNGEKCCAYNYDKNGHPLTINSISCLESRGVNCVKMCTDYNLEQRNCTVAYPYAYRSGRYCCDKGEEESDADKGEFCDGSSLSLKSTCCDGREQMCGYGPGFVCNNYYDVHPCDKEDKGGCTQKCKKVKESFVCECNRGFVLASDGKTCNKDVHPCDKENKGGCTQKCKKVNESFVCECNQGYVLAADEKTCNKDVHPCDKENKGGCSQKCKKVNESFVCECNQGFVLAADGKTCNKVVHPCDREDKGGCSQKCRKMRASFACRCNRGFILEANGKTCIKDVHPCDQENKGGCSQKCRKMKRSFVCRCNRGFVLQADGKTCNKDVHPCDQPSKGGCSQKCRKVKGSFVCKCNRRFELAADGKTCNKVVHPCDQENKGGCQQRCKKMKASFICRCRRGFVLAPDGKTCNHAKVS